MWWIAIKWPKKFKVFSVNILMHCECCPVYQNATFTSKMTVFFLNVIKAGKGCTISWLYKSISDNWLKSSCTLCSGWIINDWSLSIFNKNDGLCHMSLIAFPIARSLTLSQFISYDAESPQKYRLKGVRSSGLFRKLALSFVFFLSDIFLVKWKCCKS